MPGLKNRKGAPVCFGVCGLFHSPVAVDYWSTAGPFIDWISHCEKGEKTTLYYNRMEKKNVGSGFYTAHFLKKRDGPDHKS